MSSILRALAFLLLGLLLVGLVAGGATYVLRQLNLYPPERLSIAAGAPGSAYHDTATAYREVLARDGITLEILETAGSVENASLLAAEDGADIALVQGGVPLGPDIGGLAAVHVEPLWLFAAPGATLGEDPGRWEGVRIAAGSDGSGTRLVADALARITGAPSLAAGGVVPAGGAEAARRLLSGEVDAALFVAPVDAPYLQALFTAEAVRLVSLAHAEALSLKLPGARLVRLPSGILDYRRPLPAGPMELIALVTRLAARDELHPALVNRLVHAVLEVHGGRELLPADARYPSARHLGIPADAYAAKLLEKGFSPVEAVLPYWVAAQLNRILLVVLPATLLLLPLLRLLPAVFAMVFRGRVFRHYARVHEIDAKLARSDGALDAQALGELRAELDRIEEKLLRVNLPNSYRQQAYDLLLHVDYVRRRMDESAAAAGEARGA